MRVKIPKLGEFRPTLKNITIAGLIAVAVVCLISFFTFWFFYNRYARLTDEKLTAGPFPNSSKLYAAPESVGVGDEATPVEIASKLRDSGYAEDARSNRFGWYHLRPDAIEIFPGADSYFEDEPGVLKFASQKVSDIISLRDNAPRTEYELEPRLLSNLFDKNREKRRLVKFNDIPQVLVNAVISVEDKRFFQHSGFDPARILKALFIDLREMRNVQGASTLTQQLARNLWLNSQKTYGRKLAEMMITIHLERKLSKQQIFEYYANQIDLGRRGSFTIRGFGEASRAYFGKDIRQLSLEEAATLAGIVQQPSWRNPVRWPERAKARRNVVLGYMLENGYIAKSDYERAAAAPVVTTRHGVESTDAPYFVDLVNEQLLDQFQDQDLSGTGYRVYTTLDRQLQHEAAAAVAVGMKNVDALMKKREIKEARENKDAKDQPYEEAQVALICLDPHTGEVKALIGGRNYGASQLDHVVSKRPSGSIFKPFVYAAALSTGLTGDPSAITPATVIEDEKRTFSFNGKDYEPNNYHKTWHGTVTLRDALIKSLNVPTVAVAEQVGYQNVVNLAHKAGMNAAVRATPSVALGAYDVTPLEMSGAYTLFANEGNYVTPRFVDRVRDNSGRQVFESKLQTKRVLDPRVNYMMVNMMEDVIRSGSGAEVRRMGFTLPAAGKTGTSHDAWFAGFTDKLLCIIWVGLDDYRDLKIDGAKAALPIWADFMKRASKLRAYRAPDEFQAPEGMVALQIDPEDGQLATGACPKVRTEYFISGTEPTLFCVMHNGGSMQMAGWNGSLGFGQNSAHRNAPAFVPANPTVVPLPSQQQPVAPPPGSFQPPVPQTNAQQANPNPQQPQPEPPLEPARQRKKSVFGRIKGIFR